MTVPTTFEARLLAPLERELVSMSRLLDPDVGQARLELLEAIGAALAGFPLVDYRKRIPWETRVSPGDLDGPARRFAARIEALPIPNPLALAALSEHGLDSIERRQSGSYYTDFRLARYLANQVLDGDNKEGVALDPACGSGILLGAYAHASARGDVAKVGDVLATRIMGVDLSLYALRSTLLALSSMTPDLDAVVQLSKHLVAADSLRAGPSFWRDLAPDGFEVVIGNPPWEKLKLSRHELLRQAGIGRHYGADYSADDLAGIDVHTERSRLKGYVGEVTEAYEHQGRGETDLYKLFLELAFKLVKPGGKVGLIVPAGFIRSNGAAALRSMVFRSSEKLRVTLLDNHAAFFAIDTRFKFVVLVSRPGPGPREPVQLVHAAADSKGVAEGSVAQLGRRSLMRLRPDLSLPEVRDAREWSLFQRMMATGWRLDDRSGPWRMSFAREVDMTNDRHRFTLNPQPGDLPVVEGRMVHQFRFGVKAYVAGTGRKATWQVLPLGAEEIRPQYWIARSELSREAKLRSSRTRLGFCDITGQTNERSLLAALIPANVICGNKVPTIDLGLADDDKSRAFALWLACANSLPFDWLLRRVVTTSVNYFVLRNLAFPPLWIDDLRAVRIGRLASQVMDHQVAVHRPDGWHLGNLRAEIDAQVAIAWGLGLEDVNLILRDFPLLDRGEPPLPGEEESTVTADLFRLKVADLSGSVVDVVPRLRDRVSRAKRCGAIPYRPSEHARRAEPYVQPLMERASGK